MRVNKLKVTVIVNHDIEVSSLIFKPLLHTLRTKDYKQLREILVESLRSEKHESVWEGMDVNMRVIIERVDDSAGRTCASCKFASTDGKGSICQYNTSNDYGLLCDFHEWDEALLSGAHLKPATPASDSSEE